MEPDLPAPALTCVGPCGLIEASKFRVDDRHGGGERVEAVIISGGKQYWVREGEVVRLERLPAEQGATVEFREIACLKGDGELIVTPEALRAARVLGQVVRLGRGRKVVVVKFKRRKNYRRHQGHRQPYTAVRITRIEPGT
jgi:large subunit ribosomal protein L21